MLGSFSRFFLRPRPRLDPFGPQRPLPSIITNPALCRTVLLQEFPMPQFVVRRGYDAFVYYETIVEAESPTEARQIARDIMYPGEWFATGDVSEFDDYEIDEFNGVRPLDDGEVIEEVVSFGVTARERDAVLAGLRLLQIAVRTGGFPPMVQQIYTNDGAHTGLDANAIDTLCARTNV